LCDASEDEFKEIVDLVGMSSKPLHVKRLRKVLDEHKKEIRMKRMKKTTSLKKKLNIGREEGE
jgi:hypothetical protein